MNKLLSLLLMSPIFGFAQSDPLIVKAGDDIILCPGDMEVPELCAEITGGVTPYVIKWRMVGVDEIEMFGETMLMDSAKQCVDLKMQLDIPKTQYEIKVTDAVGSVVRDTITYLQGVANYTEELLERHINKGDTIRLRTNIGSFHLLVSYKWTPTESLMHGHTSMPFAFPDTSTVYNLEAIDSIGCIWRDQYRVFVD